MTLTALQALTWSTVTGAVVSALLLASQNSGISDRSSPGRVVTTPLPAAVGADTRLQHHGVRIKQVSDTAPKRETIAR
jgi:hypothetical protein